MTNPAQQLPQNIALALTLSAEGTSGRLSLREIDQHMNEMDDALLPITVDGYQFIYSPYRGILIVWQPDSNGWSTLIGYATNYEARRVYEMAGAVDLIDRRGSKCTGRYSMK